MDKPALTDTRKMTFFFPIHVVKDMEIIKDFIKTRPEYKKSYPKTDMNNYELIIALIKTIRERIEVQNEF